MARIKYNKGYSLFDIRRIKVELHLNHPFGTPEMVWDDHLISGRFSLGILGECLSGELQLRMNRDFLAPGFGFTSYHIIPTYEDNRFCFVYGIDSAGDEHQIYCGIAEPPEAQDEIGEVWRIPLLPPSELTLNRQAVEDNNLFVAIPRHVPFNNQPRLYGGGGGTIRYGQSYNDYWDEGLSFKEGGTYGFAADLNFTAGYPDEVPTNRRVFYDYDYRCLSLKPEAPAKQEYLTQIYKYSSNDNINDPPEIENATNVPAWTPERVRFIDGQVTSRVITTSRQMQLNVSSSSQAGAGFDNISISMTANYTPNESGWTVIRASAAFRYSITANGDIHAGFNYGDRSQKFQAVSQNNEFLRLTSTGTGTSLGGSISLSGKETSANFQLQADPVNGFVWMERTDYTVLHYVDPKDRDLLRRGNPRAGRGWSFRLQGVHAAIWARGFPNTPDVLPCTTVIEYTGSINDSLPTITTAVRAGTLPGA